MVAEALRPEENTAPETTCRCESCKLARFEGHKLRNAVVHNYSYQPRSWRPRSVKDDPFSYYLGVELETDSYKWTQDSKGLPLHYAYSNVSNEVAADMRRPKQLWVPKHDSSVTGPEFASHPATLTYWRAHKRELSDMFRMLLHAGYRSHDNDRCGMHINVSRSAIEDSGHLYRWLTLLNFNPRWSIRMAQRTRESAERWAKLSLQDAADRQSVARTSFSRYGGSADRYSAVNAPFGESRFEFRLPRGTLRIDRFFKNLEWTVAMVEYTRTAKVADCKPTKFMSWVMENRAQYPHLAAFLVERNMAFDLNAVA